MIERKTNHNGNKEASKCKKKLVRYSQGQTGSNRTLMLSFAAHFKQNNNKSNNYNYEEKSVHLYSVFSMQPLIENVGKIALSFAHFGAKVFLLLC